MKNRIRVERAEVRMTQQQLADAVGVSRQTVNAVETGKFVPSTLLAFYPDFSHFLRHAGRNRLHTVRSGPPHSAKRHSGRKEIACPPPGASTTSIASAEVT